MTNDEFVTKYLIESDDIKRAFKRLTSGSDRYKEDLWQELMLSYLEMDNDKINQLVSQGPGRVKGHFIVTCKNFLHSNTSSFYWKYRHRIEKRHVELNEQVYGLTNEEVQREEDDDYGERVARIYNKILDTLHWYDAELFNLYLEHSDEPGTLRRISQITGIPYGAVQMSIYNTRKYLQYQINTELNKQDKGLNK